MKEKTRWKVLCIALAATLVLLAGCQDSPPPASAIQLHGENGELSNLTWISIDANLTPLTSDEPVLDSIFLTAGIYTPACGYAGGVEISVYSRGNLIWAKTAQQKVAFVQPIPLLSVKKTVKPDSRVVVARGNAYIQLDFYTLVGHTKKLSDGTEFCEYLPSSIDLVPDLDDINIGPGPNIEPELFSEGSLRLDIPPANQTPTPRPIPTLVTPPPQGCQPPYITDLSFNPSSPAMIGTIVDIRAKANWNSCFRAMRLRIDNNVAYELGQPSFTYSWNTSVFTAGNHIIRLEVAAQGDSDWSNPSVQETSVFDNLKVGHPMKN